MHRTIISTTGRSTSTAMEPTMDSTTAIVILVAGFIIALLLFFLVARMKDPSSPFAKKMKNFLNFKSLIIDGIIEFLYIFMAIIVSASAIWTMFQFDTVNYSVLIGLIGLVIGNVLLRVVFEMIMLWIGLWQNTTDIYRLLEQKYGMTRAEAKEALKELKKEAKK